MIRRTLRRSLLLSTLGLVACVHSHVAVLSTPAADVATSPDEANAAQNYQVRWLENVVGGTPGCFFFSGPALPENEVRNPLGESVSLQRTEGHMTARMGDVVFSGATGAVRLESTRTFVSGEKWYVTETLEFDDGAAPRSGTYRYRECSQSQGAHCESGCTIDSAFSLHE